MFSDIKIRSITALFLTSVSFVTLYLGGLYLKIFLSLISVVLFFEWMRIISRNHWIVRGFVSILFFILVFYSEGYNAIDLLIVVSGILILSSFSSFFSISSFWSSFGFFYILASISIIELMRSTEKGLIGILIVLSTIIISDISGYIFGKLLSGPRIFKTISPNKTYSGFAASLIFGVFWFSILSISFSNYNIFGYLIVGFLIVLSSISGDLLLSFLKRKVDLKDSGSFLPGHGGLFDRADSILSVFFFLLPLSILSGNLENPIKLILG